MHKKLYVGGVPYSFGNRELEQLFQTIGPVVSARIIMDRDSGRSKGFGFVEMETLADAQKAIRQLNGIEQGRRRITVNEAKPDREHTGHGSSFGGNKRDRW